MAFILTVAYFILYFLTPTFVLGPLAQVRIEMYLAILILLISLPRLFRSSPLKTPQAIAVAGLAIVVFLSVLLATRWPGGAINAFVEFIPSIYAFFIVSLYCNSLKKLNILVLLLLFVCLFVIVNGVIDLRRGVPEGGQGTSPDAQNFDRALWDFQHPYLLRMKSDTGDPLYRLRGPGEINDPNDFAQLLVCEIPLLFLFWRPKKALRNLLFVVVPACVLVYGIYLTHSRGALLALVAVVLVAARRRIGTIPAVVLAGALFAGAMALQFSGGRAISATAGEDRTELWGESLQILKSYPVFGIGMGQLASYIGHTAHNSIVVCVTELGLVGLFFWTLFLLPTVRNAFLMASPGKVEEAKIAGTIDDHSPFKAWVGPALDKPEINRWGFCLLLSFTGFLAAGWFLSRAFVMTFFLLGGVVEAVYEEALRQGMVAPRPPMKRILLNSLGLTFALVVVVYIMLRVLNLSR